MSKKAKQQEKDMEAFLQTLKPGTVFQTVVSSDLIKKPTAGVCSGLMTRMAEDGQQVLGKSIYTSSAERTVYIWQLWDEDRRSPLYCEGWDREVKYEDLVGATPDWRFGFPYEMPNEAAATVLVSVIRNRGPEIVNEAIRQYVHPGLAKIRSTTVGELLDREKGRKR